MKDISRIIENIQALELRLQISESDLYMAHSNNIDVIDEMFNGPENCNLICNELENISKSQSGDFFLALNKNRTYI